LKKKSLPIIKKKQLNYPNSSIIVKPSAEGGGVGVTIDIGGENKHTKKRKLDDNNEKLEMAIKKAFHCSELYPYVIVQEQVYGNEFRIYLLKGQIIAVFEKVPCSIQGDGKQTINNLIEIENNKKWRKDSGFLIKKSKELIDYLHTTYCYTLDTILDQDKKLILHSLWNIGQGAASVDRTDDIHISFQEKLSKLYTQYHFTQIGLDILCEDISKNINEQKYYVIEVNDKSGFRSHHNPSGGKKRNVARAILGAVFPEITSTEIYKSEGGPAPGEMLRN